MEKNRPVQALPTRVEPIQVFPGMKSWLPPWLFRHEELIDAVENAETISQEALTNTINHIHFTDGHVHVLLRHPLYHESILLRARPEPSFGNNVICYWADDEKQGLELERFQLLFVVIDDGRSMIMVPAEVKEINREFVVIQMPLAGYAVGQRRARRFACREVAAELIQSGFQARGELVDFSPLGFRVKVTPDKLCSFRWFNSDELATIHLRRDHRLIFSGACRCVRQRISSEEREIVLAPVEKDIRRFKKKRIRNLRQHLVPSPSVVFDHPFLGRRVQLDVDDISTSGFSVTEDVDYRVLMPGMIIHEVVIKFAGLLKMNGTAQVIYGYEVDGKGVRCGLAILDMDINNYSSLTHILTSALDPHAHISTEVDMDALWEFFFRAGFIYPKKYRLIQSQKGKFKETYQKLYLENPEIARHFTYEKGGRIYGHISMVRAYDRAWMIHHHAAKAMESKRTGFIVLKQIMHYLNDMHRLPSANMDYVMCYFRPENKFPDRVFGGFARELANYGGCSMDLFAYLPYTHLSLGIHLPEGWTLRECNARDLWELNRFYSNHSGGLLLDALPLARKESRSDSLEGLYDRLGFSRTWEAYSLSCRDGLKAVLVMDQSNLGFNLSELLNSIKVLVTDSAGLPWDILSTALSQLTAKYQMEKIPILFYPYAYVEAKAIPHEKQYQLWILNVQYGNEYLEYMQRKFRISYT